MKSILLFVFTLNCLLLDGQIFLSFGINQQTETLDNIQDHLKFRKKQMIHTNNVFYLKGNYIKNHFAAGFELFSFSKEDAFVYSGFSKTTGGGSSPIYQTMKSYYANVDYNYNGFKLGGSFYNEGQSLLFKNASATIQIGAFLECDFLMRYRESNHSTHTILSNNSNMSQTMVVTKDEYTYESFQAMKARNKIISMGLMFNRRLIYKNVFLEVNLSAGLLGDYRITATPPDTDPNYKNGGKKFFVGSGFGIGYKF